MKFSAQKQVLKRGLRIVSIFEAIKGGLVLVTGFGILNYIHKDLHLGAERLVRLFHLDPASHYPRIFIDLANHLTSHQLWALALAAMLYAIVRLVEAYGLWHERPWAEWIGIITGSAYIPIEIYEVLHEVTWPRVTLLSVNVSIVAYLAWLRPWNNFSQGK